MCTPTFSKKQTSYTEMARVKRSSGREYQRLSQSPDSDEEITLYPLSAPAPTSSPSSAEFGRGIYDKTRDLELPASPSSSSSVKRRRRLRAAELMVKTRRRGWVREAKACLCFLGLLVAALGLLALAWATLGDSSKTQLTSPPQQAFSSFSAIISPSSATIFPPAPSPPAAAAAGPTDSSSEPPSVTTDSSSEDSLPPSVTTDSSSSEDSLPPSVTTDSSSSEDSLPPSDSSSPEDSLPPSDSSSSEDSLPPSDSSSSEDSLPPSDSSNSEDSLPPSDSSSSEDSLPPSDSSSSEDSLPPSDSSSPEDSLSPSDSSSPEDSLPPSDSSSPEDSLPPSDSSSPEDSLSPSDSSSPEDSLPPSDSSSPEDSLPPSDSSSPEDSLPPSDSSSSEPHSEETVTTDNSSPESHSEETVSVSSVATTSLPVVEASQSGAVDEPSLASSVGGTTTLSPDSPITSLPDSLLTPAPNSPSTPSQSSPSTHSPESPAPSDAREKRAISWHREFFPALTETALQLRDLSGDGVSDVVMVEGRGQCEMVLRVLDGLTGNSVWTANVSYDAFSVRCEVDLNTDGHVDCIAGGRQSGFRAISGTDGSMLWDRDPRLAFIHYNFYFPLFVPDLDGDGVQDILVTHGGDSSYGDEEVNRSPGFLTAISGQTGRQLMERVPLPDGRETYNSPVLLSRDEGDMVLVGTGGETLPGALWAFSYTSLRQRIAQYLVAERGTGYTPFTGYINHVCERDMSMEDMELQRPRFDVGSYDTARNTEKDPNLSHCLAWGQHQAVWNKFGLCVYQLVSTEEKGVLLPPVMAEMTGDHQLDLIVSVFEGKTLLINGDNGEVVWEVSQPGTEAYR